MSPTDLHGLHDLRFLRACRREPVDRTPVWFMRQAGRYMAEYRDLRQNYTLLNLCRTPDLATEVTLQPLRRIDVDAAILFSDLLLPLEPMGIPFDFVKGEGPAIERPIRTGADIDRVQVIDPREALPFTFDAIRSIKRELAGRVPLIGFAGAPFTLASYAIEGGHSNNFALTKSLMYGDPAAWHRLADKLATWSPTISSRRSTRASTPCRCSTPGSGRSTPTTIASSRFPTRDGFSTPSRGAACRRSTSGSQPASILHVMREAGGDVIGADWRIPLDEAWERIGADRGIQGNLDPTLLLGPRERLLAGAAEVLTRAVGRPGHIFNLGHGILPSTPIENVQALARFVHQHSAHRA